MRLPIVLAAGFLLSGCLGATSEDYFIRGRVENPCTGVWHACKGQTAGCVLDEEHYVRGTFPGQRKFIVVTPDGAWKIEVKLFLEDRLAPGTETEVHWFEPGCTDEYTYRLTEEKATTDLFELSGRDQVLEVQHSVHEGGDHLISVWSDATCRYDLRIELSR
jgi:hypothetical protein